MLFLKKVWFFALVAVIVCLVCFIFGRSQAPDVPVTIYKTVETPTPQREIDRRARDITTETDKQAPQTLDTSQVAKSESEETVLDEIDSDALNSFSVGHDGEMTERVVAAPDNAKGEVPPELSSEAMEHLHEEHRRQIRIRDILEELSTYANRDISNEEFLRVIDLQEELQNIEKERGNLQEDDLGLSAAFDYVRFAATHMTEDGRFPTQQGQRLLEGLRSTVPDTPERQQAIEHLTRVLNIAIENGDEYFKLGSAGQ